MIIRFSIFLLSVAICGLTACSSIEDNTVEYTGGQEQCVVRSKLHTVPAPLCMQSYEKRRNSTDFKY